MSEFILVTDWERVTEDDFYLEDEWLDREEMSITDKEELRNRVKNGNIYIGYIVKATNYCIYNEMDAKQVLIDGDLNVLVDCESAIIGNNHDKRIEYEY